MAESGWILDVDGDWEDAGAIRIAEDVASNERGDENAVEDRCDGVICIAEDEANDDCADENAVDRYDGICIAEDEANDECTDENGVEEGVEAEESSGVHSEAGGFPVLVLASRLHMGQNVLQVVSHESTQTAWNSVKESNNDKVSLDTNGKS